jgi:hypothetical protein
MHQFDVRSVLSVRGMLFFVALVALPAGARASDMSFDGGSGCSDPPITSDIFTLPATSSAIAGSPGTGGGLCRAFGNHTTMNFNSLKFTAAFPTTINDPFLCSPGPFFLNCDFVIDGTTVLQSGEFARSVGKIVTVEFFGLDTGPGGTHLGIPIDRNTDSASPAYYNFFINLNNPVLNPATGGFSQPHTAAGSGDWQPDDTFQGAANDATPEPGTLALLMSAAGALLARNLWRKTGFRG